MIDILNNFCNNDKPNGLLLINLGTGTGKTYNVLKFIHEESLKEENSNKKYIFVTNLKKNLPEDDLRKMFTDSGHKEEFDKKYLIASNICQMLSP